MAIDRATIHSASDASLFSVVRSAASAVSGAGRGPVGRLEIVEQNAEDQPQLSLEATVSAHGVGWTIEQLDVRWRAVNAEPVTPDVVRALLEFGSSRFTNLTLADTTGEIADLTLSFSSRFTFWGQLVTLMRPVLSLDDRAMLDSALHALGVAGRTLGIASRKHLLRAPPTSDAQAQAFGSMARPGFRVDLYTSALPATHAVRLAQDRVTGATSKLDLCISYGLSGNSPPTTNDERRTEDFLRRYFAVQFANKSWQVTNTHGADDQYRPHGAIPHSTRRGWSLNWGQR